MLKKQLSGAKEKLGEAKEEVEKIRTAAAAHYKAQRGKLKEEADAAAGRVDGVFSAHVGTRCAAACRP